MGGDHFFDIKYIHGKTIQGRLHGFEIEEVKIRLAEQAAKQVAEQLVDVPKQAQNLTRHKVCGVQRDRGARVERRGIGFDQRLTVHVHVHLQG